MKLSRDDMKRQSAWPKKTAALIERQRLQYALINNWLAAAARRAAGTRLHAGEHETLAIMKIDVRVHEHAVGPFLQENFEAAQIEGRIARLGFFGYVHSQRRASASGDYEDPHAVSGSSLLLHDFFELLYCVVRQTYHYFLLTEF